MKYSILTIAIMTLMLVELHGQPILDDNALLIPQNQILFLDQKSGELRKSTVAPCIVGRYPESNYQYQAYLEYLLKENEMIVICADLEEMGEMSKEGVTSLGTVGILGIKVMDNDSLQIAGRDELLAPIRFGRADLSLNFGKNF